MDITSKVLIGLPAGLGLALWLSVEMGTLIKISLGKSDPAEEAQTLIWRKIVEKTKLKDTSLRLSKRHVATAEVRIPLFGPTQIVISHGLSRLAPHVIEAALAHEAGHLVCQHAKLMRWWIMLFLITFPLCLRIIIPATPSQLIPFGLAVVILTYPFIFHWMEVIFLPRFLERQADARAAAWLSGDTHAITSEATEQLAEAVRAIAAANHGHVAGIKRTEARIGRIRALANQPCFHTAPDRAIRRIWAASFALLALDVAAIVWLALR